MAGKERVVPGFTNQVLVAGSRFLPDVVKSRLNRLVTKP